MFVSILYSFSLYVELPLHFIYAYNLWLIISTFNMYYLVSSPRAALWCAEELVLFEIIIRNIHACYSHVMCVCAQLLSGVWLFTTPWTVTRQTPLSMGFPWQEYWSGLPCPPPGNLPNPGIKPTSLASPILTGGFFASKPPGKSISILYLINYSSSWMILDHL